MLEKPTQSLLERILLSNTLKPKLTAKNISFAHKNQKWIIIWVQDHEGSVIIDWNNWPVYAHTCQPFTKRIFSQLLYKNKDQSISSTSRYRTSIGNGTMMSTVYSIGRQIRLCIFIKLNCIPCMYGCIRQQQQNHCKWILQNCICVEASEKWMNDTI